MKKNNFCMKPGFFTCLLIIFLLISPAVSRLMEVSAFKNAKVGASSQTGESSKQTRKKKAKRVQNMDQKKLVSVPESTWGANGIRLVVGETAVIIEYDCADGKIEEPLKVDEQGNFSANGVHIRQKGGPIREGSTPASQSARYQGRISGDKMTLKVTLTESGELIGTYTLDRGKTPRMHRCY